MYPTLRDLTGLPMPLSTHDLFVRLGVAAAGVVFVLEARRRDQTDERIWVRRGWAHWSVGRSSPGSAPGSSTSTCGDNASLAEQWLYGNRSILSGLVGA